ncbi:hypothetical protein IGB42_02653 [Andreprevotia sp. IGB-42]|uniref:hypothetical protein n=1 Tax=Andreprevotia sp. IGB-42 TaxID=2497473 RepID=UPI00135CF729|nr:hypothetical protein [Andreprevotia sp. IGB-42]KAF0812810.1 hypothetical protein IGB42_02653 [Andreprevotia sp. IGB-42]
MGIREWWAQRAGKPGVTVVPPATAQIPGSEPRPTSELGARANPDQQVSRIYQQMSVDFDLRATILQIRDMDKRDGRVKRIHARVARDIVRGGLVLQQAVENETIRQEWGRFAKRCQLNRPEKLKSDARGFLMEGNLPLQVVLDADRNVVDLVRMPAETIRPNVGPSGRFDDPAQAYTQFDLQTGSELATFALWQLHLVRLDPDNFDDYGALGRPFLDASREVWKKLRLTDENLVIRRQMRAPLRMAHVLEGAGEEDVTKYRNQVEADQAHGTVTDYYLNRKGSVTPMQGDANLDHIADVVYLLDSFFAGTPLPKGMMGYTDGMARDILEDLKRDYYDEVDLMQDTIGFAYAQAFRIQLLMKGLNPDESEYTLTFAELRTETKTQTTDRALKLKAAGLPASMVFEEMGYDPITVERRQQADGARFDPYPEPVPAAAPTVKVTPGNGRKGDSSTSISS